MHLALMQTPMPDVTIPNGSADVTLDWATDYFDAEALTIFAPTVLAETVTFTGSKDGITFNTIADLTATAVKGPTAGQVITYNGTFSGFSKIRIHLSGNAAADRTFNLIKSWRGSL